MLLDPVGLDTVQSQKIGSKRKEAEFILSPFSNFWESTVGLASASRVQTEHLWGLVRKLVIGIEKRQLCNSCTTAVIFYSHGYLQPPVCKDSNEHNIAPGSSQARSTRLVVRTPRKIPTPMASRHPDSLVGPPMTPSKDQDGLVDPLQVHIITTQIKDHDVLSDLFPVHITTTQTG